MTNAVHDMRGLENSTHFSRSVFLYRLLVGVEEATYIKVGEKINQSLIGAPNASFRFSIRTGDYSQTLRLYFALFDPMKLEKVLAK